MDAKIDRDRYGNGWGWKSTHVRDGRVRNVEMNGYKSRAEAEAAAKAFLARRDARDGRAKGEPDPEKRPATAVQAEAEETAPAKPARRRRAG